MKKSKFYAVKNKDNSKIFNTWEECKEYIKTIDKPIYKSFLTIEEASSFLNNEDNFFDTTINNESRANRLVAFTDGSFDENLCRYGSGVYIITPDNKKVEISKSSNREEFIKERNIIGEVGAVMLACNYAINNKYSAITIFCDLIHIAMWANSTWKANSISGQKLISFLKKIEPKLNVKIVKVKAHSNNKYNDYADKLAKESLLKD